MVDLGGSRCGSSIMEALESRVLMSAATRDGSFGTTGQLIGDGFGRPSPSDSGQTQMAVLRNGNIVLASKITRRNVDCQIAVYLGSGKLDRKFGTGGKVKLNFGQTDSPADVAVQDDGKVLVLINSTSRDFSRQESRLVRFTVGGKLDKTFAHRGFYYLKPSDHFRHIQINSAGQILLDGSSRICRLTPQGKIDRDFAARGTLKLSTPKPPIVPDDSVVVVDSSINSSPRLHRSDGGLAMVSALDFVATTASQQVISDVHELVVRRFTTRGKREDRFAAAGSALIDMKQAADRQISSITLADIDVTREMDILVAGHISTSVASAEGPDFVARVSNSGDLDTAFGQHGFFWLDSHISHIRATVNGGVAITARIPKPEGQDDVLVCRLDAEGKLASGFGTGGTITLDLGAREEAETLIDVQHGTLLLLVTRSTIDENFEFTSRPVISQL